MNLSFFATGLHNFFHNLPVRRLKLKRTFWLRSFSILLLGSMLLSPAGMITVRAALPAPILSAPADGATITVTEAPPLAIPEFSWQPVVGATSYHLQVSNTIGFTNIIVDITTTNTVYTSTSAVFSDTVYWWRVQVSQPGPAGNYSDVRSFNRLWATSNNAPDPISPAPGAILDFYNSPVFSWEPVLGAAKYRFMIYTSSGGGGTIVTDVITNSTTYQPLTKPANGIYYWQVIPRDDGNHNGMPGAERTFQVAYNRIPTLLEPDPTQITQPTFTPTFRWTAVQGAQYYKLQYSSDSNFNSGVTTVNTNNTSFTPTDTLPNDTNYYWRVQAWSGNSSSPWASSAPNYFVKKWTIQPVNLTPTNNYFNQRFPLFSWTPVPGASYYRVEISEFSGMSPIYDSGNTANTFFAPNIYKSSAPEYWWRVIPYDGSGNPGKPSVTTSFKNNGASVSPDLVSPLYYYPPDTYSGFPGITTNPHQDRSVAFPTFTWHRVLKPMGDPDAGEVFPDAYRLQVSTISDFSTIAWSIDTENLSATPTLTHNFTPLPNTDYYWRVCSLIGGNCSTIIVNAEVVDAWSQTWKTRFDPAKGLVPTGGSTPALIAPVNGFVFDEVTPLLTWWPKAGATSYDVEISSDSSFSAPQIVDSASVSYPAYVPSENLAERRLGAVDFGVYWWRVRQSGGTWSTPRRFEIAAQSQWKYTRTLGNVANRLQIGSDPSGDVADLDYDLTDLRAAQSGSAWYFGFHVPAAPGKNVTYALYLDIDHQDGSGGTTDPMTNTVTTITGYRPEYVLYMPRVGGAFTAASSRLYHWNGSSWDTGQDFNSAGIQVNLNGDYLELQVSDTAIAYDIDQTGGSYTLSLMSFPATAPNGPQDSVPSDPNVPGSGQVSRFANVTEQVNLSFPYNNPNGDAGSFPSIPPFVWDWPIKAPYAGSNMKAYLDQYFTSPAANANYSLESNTAYYAMVSHAWPNDLAEDNSYYWRLQPKYRDGACQLCTGAWSQGWRFERLGFIPQNLQVSTTFATPTFSWDMVEGAKSYRLQWDTENTFGSPTEVTTTQNSYTPTGTMPNSTYYWRVLVNRWGVANNQNKWSPVQTFTISLPVPSGLTPVSGTIIGTSPILCWTPLIVNSSGHPFMAAYKYKVQITKDTTTYEATTEQNCWTRNGGFADGTWSWHVAMVDGNNNVGTYSPYQTVIKQYPVTTLLTPLNGANISSTPTFIWTPVNGAAKYRLQVSQYSNFSSFTTDVTTVNTRHTPTSIYPNKRYYWRVAIIDMDGNIGPFTDATIILDPFPNHVYLPMLKK